ncbi:MAG: XTP/dITP diphosphatase [Clostridiales bacterium]|nr:XTP/dITP diphosphatase [Clostridiales bacterium]
MKIVLASRNPKKVREIESLLKREAAIRGDDVLLSIEILSLDDIGFTGEIEETGSTFEENAMLKASAVSRLGYIGLADDSGLCVDALKGAPGIYSARYAGEGANDEKNNRKLLDQLSGKSNRSARFVSVIACVFPDNDVPLLVRGECEGEILHHPRGKGGFGYDPLFYFPHFGKSFAELTEDEKNAVSHRGEALRSFVADFCDRITGKL